MALADRKAEVEAQRTVRCSLCRLVPALDDDDRQTLLDWLHDEDMPAPKIAAALQLEGHNVSKDVVWNHRNQRHESR